MSDTAGSPTHPAVSTSPKTYRYSISACALDESEYESDESVAIDEVLGVERASYMRSIIAKGNILGKIEDTGDDITSEDVAEDDENESNEYESDCWSDEEILPVEKRYRSDLNFPRRDSSQGVAMDAGNGSGGQ